MFINLQNDDKNSCYLTIDTELGKQWISAFWLDGKLSKAYNYYSHIHFCPNLFNYFHYKLWNFQICTPLS